ncbi:MAG: hypothetical protein DCC67_15805 [Planctomycetota bacterium]|nr:MAG: hypothetical protein DCC67_15805 [Planctomycetota bacterium]
MRSRTAQTIVELWQGRAAQSPSLAAFATRTAAGQWHATPWAASETQVQAIARRLLAHGLRPGDHVGVLGPASAAWHLLEHAVLRMGGVVVGLDPYAPDDQLRAMMDLARPALLAYDPQARHAALRFADRCPVVSFTELAAPDEPGRKTAGAGRREPVERSAAASPPAAPPAAPVSPDDPATLLFTSGSTGAPKAIRYTHRQLLVACRAIAGAFPAAAEGEGAMCWLPMAHLFQRMMNLVAIDQGAVIHFVDDPRTIVQAAREVRPAALIGVPRFFEKLRERVQEQIATGGPWRRRAVKLALRLGRRRHDARAVGVRLPWTVALAAALADRLVLSRLRAALGGNIRTLVTGSAPMALADLEFFAAMGWIVLEAYGVSENAVPMAANRADAYRFGSVGKPLAENTLRIAPDGEILVQGPGVFDGYVGGDRADCFTPDGYYRTGDLGRLDDDGFLYLHGRKSDVIKTSTGRKVAPARLEAAYGASPYVNHCVVVGEGRKHLAALCTLHVPAVAAWLAQRGVVENDEAALARRPDVQRLLEDQFAEIAQTLSPAERICHLAILERQLSIAAGELTTTLKLRRGQIERVHASRISALYAERPAPAAAAASGAVNTHGQ